jgi:hypothetical protein
MREYELVLDRRRTLTLLSLHVRHPIAISRVVVSGACQHQPIKRIVITSSEVAIILWEGFIMKEVSGSSKTVLNGIIYVCRVYGEQYKSEARCERKE